MARFEYGWNSRENQGVGGYRLPPPYADTAYNSTGNNQNLMLTETWVVNPKIVNETRFQYTRTYASQIGNLLPQINVSGAFTSGGANEGTNYRYPSALRIAEQHLHLPQHPHVPLRRPGAP